MKINIRQWYRKIRARRNAGRWVWQDEDSHPSGEANVAPTEELEKASLHTSKEVNQSGELTLPEPSHSESSKPEMVKATDERGKKTLSVKVKKPHISDNLDKTIDDTACVAKSACAHVATALKATDSSLVPKAEPEQKTNQKWQANNWEDTQLLWGSRGRCRGGSDSPKKQLLSYSCWISEGFGVSLHVCVRQDSLLESESSRSDCVETDCSIFITSIIRSSWPEFQPWGICWYSHSSCTFRCYPRTKRIIKQQDCR